MNAVDTIVKNTWSSLYCTILERDLASLDLHPTVQLEGKTLKVHVVAGFPSHFLKKTVETQFNQALNQMYPDYQIQLCIDHFIKAHRTQMVGKGLRGIKNTIAIASGKGGVGKSTITVNLATALASQGARVGVLDADIYGPSIPLMLGKHAPLTIQENRYQPIVAHGIEAMSIGYLANQHALLWRGPMLAKSLLHLIDHTDWNNLDYLFIDLPPGTGDIQLSLVQKIPLAGAIVVTTPQTVATLDAEKAITLFEKTGIPILGLIENMSNYTCQQCGHQTAVFSQGGAQQLANQRGYPLLAQLPLDPRITIDCDQGIPTVLQQYHTTAQCFNKAALEATIILSRTTFNYTEG